jgi:hypothetical protein
MSPEILAYLFKVAPIVLVMGVACSALWARNNTLVDKIHERDLANLKTLEQIIHVLNNLEAKGDKNHGELKAHITERVSELRLALQ